MVGGVIFDLDGVLIDTSSTWHAVMNDAARHLGFPLVSAARFNSTFGQGTAADVATFFHGVDPDELDAFYERRFFARIDDVTIIPGAREILDSLKQVGLLRAVATNTVRPLAEVLLDRVGIAGRVEAVVTASDVPRPKPAPDMVLRALTKLALDRANAWFVGDSPYDAAAAHDAGVSFVGFRREGDCRIEQLDELLEAVVGKAVTPARAKRGRSMPAKKRSPQSTT